VSTNCLSDRLSTDSDMSVFLNYYSFSAVLVTHVYISVEATISVVTTRTRRNYGLCNNNTDNESIDTQDTRHDNGNDILDDSCGVIHSHIAQSETGPPGSPGTSPTRTDHANGSTRVSTVCNETEQK
jgi:hypothetical protein